jgi:glucose-6-phosphate 1-dehydrogenase
MITKLIVFGITGDLGTRKLLPALETIVNTGDFNDLSIIGVSRREVQKEDLIKSCKIGSLFCQKISMYTMDLDNEEDYRKLKAHVDLKDDEQLLVYLAVPPLALSGIVENLGLVGMNAQNVKILFEKPFGIDLESARDVIGYVNQFYQEHQIYRIDHFLAKEMAQNIITFRGYNALFDHIWNNEFIESIEIVAAEEIGIEDRVQLYEQIGALRDVVQGHLMQLLALALMDIPSDFAWEELPKFRLEALNKLSLANPDTAVRGQYVDYRHEVNNEHSKIETFASIELESFDEKWLGVPIKLTTGKAMSEKTTEIRIRLRQTKAGQSNNLVFRIQPNEGINIELYTKKPGYDRSLEVRNLSFNYPEDVSMPDAYEQVLVDAISSQKSLFTSSEEVLRSWEILAPVQKKWGESDDDMIFYQRGTDLHSI